ncbi:MAG: FAD/NAD(P)-binding protein [Anaerolineales bacterium]|nr:FAD/NAD(P)-binding protein [Anaerolineales bacterium]
MISNSFQNQAVMESVTAVEDTLFMPVLGRIIDVKPMTALERLFTIELPDGMSLGHRPGQFVEVSVFGIGEAPISISSSPSRSDRTFELCVRNVGDVTGALHRMKAGDQIGIRGPFGRGFPIEKFRGKDVLFAPGGLGLAPLRSLINQVLDERALFDRVIILYGAKSPSEMLFKDELAEWDARTDVELMLTVDQGDDTWKGNVGVITTLFKHISINPRNTVGVTCGPPVMYRFVLMEFFGKGISEGNIYLSLERRMKCGIGKCGHCQINNVYACQSGPVFPYSEIKGLEEAL